MPDARAREQRILIVGFVAFLGAQQAAIPEERHLHAVLDLIV